MFSSNQKSRATFLELFGEAFEKIAKPETKKMIDEAIEKAAKPQTREIIGEAFEDFIRPEMQRMIDAAFDERLTPLQRDITHMEATIYPKLDEIHFRLNTIEKKMDVFERKFVAHDLELRQARTLVLSFKKELEKLGKKVVTLEAYVRAAQKNGLKKRVAR